jgi:hypothetical protein
VTIADQIINLSIPINLDIDERVLLSMSVDPLSSTCFVSGYDRQFTVGLSNLSFSNQEFINSQYVIFPLPSKYSGKS